MTEKELDAAVAASANKNSPVALSEKERREAVAEVL
jgi:hypothetical protein